MKCLNKKLFFVSLFLTLGLVLLVAASFLIEPEVVEIVSPPQAVTPAEKKEITIILVGDIMLNRGVKDMIDEYGDGDFKFPFLEMADYLNEADIVFGNLESVISDKGIKIGSIYSFRADPKAIEGLIFAGFDVVSVANNHIFDYGRVAMEDSFARLKEAEIAYAGGGFNEEETYAPIIKEIGGGSTGSPRVKIAFLAYTNLGPETWQASGENSGIAWISENYFERIEEDIKSTKENSDILIVSLHAGEEYKKEPTQFQVDFAKMAIDSGADLVVGHHPHAVQPMEIRRLAERKGYIAYSLGNFVFDQDFSDQTMRGQIVKVLIENGKIKEAIPIDIKINDFFQPEIFK